MACSQAAIRLPPQVKWMVPNQRRRRASSVLLLLDDVSAGGIFPQGRIVLVLRRNELREVRLAVICGEGDRRGGATGSGSAGAQTECKEGSGGEGNQSFHGKILSKMTR